MLWQNLNNKTIGIWGMGKEGQAAAEALFKHCHNFNIVEINEDNTSQINKCDVLIKSPGVSLYRDEIKQAQNRGIIVTSGTNLFFANKPANLKVIAVTGTKGKSTTASLLYHTMQQQRCKVVLGGNIGVPLVTLSDETADWCVAEMSSYQCADCLGKPEIGVLMNLYPEHLQWHQSHERYWGDKINMINQAETKLLNAKDQRTADLVDATDAWWFNNQQGLHLSQGYFCDGSTRLFPQTVLTTLGDHNAENACAVLSIIKLLGLSLTDCAKAFADFKPLPHRLQKVAETRGITFIDDSISTTPETAVAAIKALDKGQVITLIAGGFDRGQDYLELGRFLQSLGQRVRLVALPDTGSRIIASATGVISQAVDNMQQAVATAVAFTPQGGTVILSPAAPSYNCYKNFEARGEDFTKAIKKLAK